MSEKCLDVAYRARDFYVDHVGYIKSVDEFKSEIKERNDRVDSDYADCKKAIAESKESLRKALKLSEVDFNGAYMNSGFLESPLSCFNKVIMSLRLEEERMLSYVQQSVNQAVWLFDYNFQQMAKKVKTNKSKN
jgi:hypothetical protein